MRAYWQNVSDGSGNLGNGTDHYDFFTNNCAENVARALVAAGNDGNFNLADIGHLISLYPNAAAVFIMLHGMLPTNLSDIQSVQNSQVTTSGWSTVKPSL
jgi:hypothetical protein